jgi:hypothetical protein
MTCKPKNILFGIIWMVVFFVFAFYIYGGKIFEPDTNGKINIMAILIAWVAEYISKLGTASIVPVTGLAIGAKIPLSKK